MVSLDSGAAEGLEQLLLDIGSTVDCSMNLTQRAEVSLFSVRSPTDAFEPMTETSRRCIDCRVRPACVDPSRQRLSAVSRPSPALPPNESASDRRYP